MSLWDGSIALPESESSGCFGPGETRELSEIEDIAKRLGIPSRSFPSRISTRSPCWITSARILRRGAPKSVRQVQSAYEIRFLIDSAAHSGSTSTISRQGTTPASRTARFSAWRRIRKKDQSYFLSRLKPAQLRVMFPLGESVKDDIRDFAREKTDSGISRTNPKAGTSSNTMIAPCSSTRATSAKAISWTCTGNVPGRHQGIVHHDRPAQGLGIGGLADPLVRRAPGREEQSGRARTPRRALLRIPARRRFNPLAISAGTPKENASRKSGTVTRPNPRYTN